MVPPMLRSTCLFLMILTLMGCKKEQREPAAGGSGGPNKALPGRSGINSINHKVEWKTYTEKKGGFSVAYAGVKIATTTDQKGPDGKTIKVSNLFFNVNEDVFVVHWLPRGPQKPSQQELRIRMASSAKKMSASLAQVQTFSVGGHPAIRAEATSKRGFKLLQMVATPTTLYIVAAQLKSRLQNRENGEHFLNSFTLL